MDSGAERGRGGAPAGGVRMSGDGRTAAIVRMCRYHASRVVDEGGLSGPCNSVGPSPREGAKHSKVGANIRATSADARVRGAMAPWTTTPGSETRGAGAPPSTNGTPSTAYLNRARELAERVQASLESNVRHDALYAALASSPATETFAASRAKELMDELIAAGGDGGWRPAEATPRGGDRRDDDATVGGSPPRSPRPRRDDDDPGDPRAARRRTTRVVRDTGVGRADAVAHTPTPVDPIEALLSERRAGADVPVVVVASSDENVLAKDNDVATAATATSTRRRRLGRPRVGPARSASRTGNRTAPVRPPLPRLPHCRPPRRGRARQRAEPSRLDAERRRNDRLARKLTRAGRRRVAPRTTWRAPRTREERCELDTSNWAKNRHWKNPRAGRGRREAHEATRRALERRVKDLRR